MCFVLVWRPKVKKVELFELIRKQFFLQNKSKRKIAKDLKIHRRIVREALSSPTPASRKTTNRQPTVLTEDYKMLIKSWLLEDVHAPKKQRHTNTRIYNRLCEEFNYPGQAGNVRKHVAKVRKELNLTGEAFVPQVRQPGEEAEVDWYEACVDFPTGRRKIYLFEMRACYSGKEFHMAFFNQDQQSFIEGHIQAFKFFGGVFKILRYDNLSSAVKKVLQGRKRNETERFITLRSHYLFDSEFCRPGKEGAHEKGGVEGGVGRFRRNNLVPVPLFENLDALNAYIYKCTEKDNSRTISGKLFTIAEDWEHECSNLITLPAAEFCASDVYNPTVNSKGLIRVKNVFYSVPIKLYGGKVEAKLFSNEIICYKSGVEIAKHVRSFEAGAIVTNLDHYLDLLYRKPGALAKSLPLKQFKESGQWPGEFEKYWQELKARYGDHKGNQQIIEVLLLLREHSFEVVYKAVCCALEKGCFDVSAIVFLLRFFSTNQQQEVPLTDEDINLLTKFNRPLPQCDDYNSLLH